MLFGEFRMRLSLGTAVWLALVVGSCARTSEVQEARNYAGSVEAYALDLERRMDRRLDDLEGRMDEVEIYAEEACAQLSC